MSGWAYLLLYTKPDGRNPEHGHDISYVWKMISGVLHIMIF